MRAALTTLLSFLLIAPGASPQLLDPHKLLEPATDTWPTYNGDYSGRRYSTLDQVSAKNIKTLAPAWMFRISNVGALRGVGCA